VIKKASETRRPWSALGCRPTEIIINNNNNNSLVELTLEFKGLNKVEVWPFFIAQHFG
jgi:hypothetical protein